MKEGLRIPFVRNLVTEREHKSSYTLVSERDAVYQITECEVTKGTRKKRHIHFASDGLKVIVGESARSIRYQVDGRSIKITSGTMVGHMDFVVARFSERKDGSRSANKHEAILAMVTNASDLMHYFDRTTFIKAPEFLVGQTNQKMADFTKNLGFSVTYKKVLVTTSGW